MLGPLGHYVYMHISGFQLILPFALLLLTACGSVAWIWLLRRQLRSTASDLKAEHERRTQAEEALSSSESRFKTIADTSPVAILIFQNDRWIYANKTAQHLTGYTEAELCGMNFWEITHPDSTEFIKKRGQQRQRGTDLQYQRTEVRIMTRDGGEKWVEFAAETISTDEMPAGLVTAIDITERKMADMALREQQKLMRTVFASIPDCLMLKDRTLTYKTVNQAFCGVVKLPNEKIIGKSDRDLFPREKAERWEDEDRIILNGGIANIKEEIEETIEGLRYLEVMRTPVLNENPEPEGILYAIRDITERKLSENQKREDQARLQEARKFESLSVMAGSVAHNFNNLLMIVRGNLEMALNEVPDDSKLNKKIHSADVAAKRAAELSALMLTYVGKNRQDTQVVDIEGLVREATAHMGAGETENITVRMNSDQDSSLISGDKSQIRDCIVHLIQNAVEAIGENKGTIRIDVSKHFYEKEYFQKAFLAEELPDGYYVCLTISDTGGGIDSDVLPKVFDPFFTTKFTGRGLGLAAVFGIVRAHRGAVAIESDQGVGTTAKVVFPAVDARTERQDKKSRPRETRKFDGAVLFVDDEAMIRDIGEAMLTRLGFDVFVAETGMAAIDIFRQHQDEIRLVILDLEMPGMNGKECYYQLLGIKSDINIIFASGYGKDRAEQEFSSGIPSEYIAKPFDVDKLADKIEKTLADR